MCSISERQQIQSFTRTLSGIDVIIMTYHFDWLYRGELPHLRISYEGLTRRCGVMVACDGDIAKSYVRRSLSLYIYCSHTRVAQTLGSAVTRRCEAVTLRHFECEVDCPISVRDCNRLAACDVVGATLTTYQSPYVDQEHDSTTLPSNGI